MARRQPRQPQARGASARSLRHDVGQPRFRYPLRRRPLAARHVRVPRPRLEMSNPQPLANALQRPARRELGATTPVGEATHPGRTRPPLCQTLGSKTFKLETIDRTEWQGLLKSCRGRTRELRRCLQPALVGDMGAIAHETRGPAIGSSALGVPRRLLLNRSPAGDTSSARTGCFELAPGESHPVDLHNRVARTHSGELHDTQSNQGV